MVGESGSAKEAERIIPALRPHVAVLDARLPDGSGIDVCRRLKADPAAAQTCTAQAQRLSEEKEDQLNGAVLTSSELGNYGTDEKHCVVYGVSGEWEGQIVDPEITLETASADA